MDDARTWKVSSREAMHALPCPTRATKLAATSNDVMPETSHLVNETTNVVAVAGDGMIVEPPPDNAPKPSGRFAQRSVHSFSQLKLDRL